MKKRSSIVIIALIISVLLSENVLAIRPLRNPQGRIGTGYKTEKYRPMIKTNMTPAEMKKIGDLIKQQEEVKKQIAKEYNNKLAQQQEQQRKKLKLQEEQKKQQLKHEKEQKEMLLAQEQKKKQEEQRLIAEQQRQHIAEQKTLAKKKLEEQKQLEKQRISEEKQKEKIEKKDLQDNSIEKEFEEVASHKFDRVKNMLSFKKSVNEKEAVNKVEQTQEVKPPEKKQQEHKTKLAIKTNTNQDPQTKAIVKEISTELANDRTQMLEELSTLWVSAVQKSDTVYFAIMKLSNPNGEDVNKKGVKKILEPILSAAPLVGQAFVNPALTAGSLIGSSVMGSMMNDSATRRLTKVNDADLVILARAIDELQENLLLNYMTYKNALKEYELSIKITAERKKVYDKLNTENSPNVILANTFYTEALDNQYKARQDFLMKRVVLEQMVGSEALNEIETKKVTTEQSE